VQTFARQRCFKKAISTAAAHLVCSFCLLTSGSAAFAQFPWWVPLHISTIETQSDSKVLIVGGFDTFTGLEGKAVVRLNHDGSIDPSFNAALTDYNSIISILAQPDDKVLVSQNNSNGIVRLNVDGTLDPGFQLQWVQGEWFSYILPVGVQSDGKILAMGQFTAIAGDKTNYGLARFETNGNVDATFHARLSYLDQPAMPYSVLLQPDGRILVTGQFDEINDEPVSWTARLNNDGSVDHSFIGTNNIYYYNQFFDLQSDGKIITADPLGLTRLNPNGTLDPRFNPGLGVGGTNRYVSSAKIQRETNLLVFGRFEYYDGEYRKSIARVNGDGTLDQSFDAGLELNLPFSFPTMQQSPVVNAVKVLPDHSFLVAGSFSHVQGKPSGSLVRFTADGQLDQSFQAFQPRIRDISLTSDGFYQFLIEGHRGRSYRVEASTDFKNWLPLRNFVITGPPFHYIDLNPRSGHFFYRITAL
jgi:uncharacterized delta-60 repeat protein